MTTLPTTTFPKTAFPTTWPHDVLTLGIDIGGTGLKAAVVDSQGVMVSDRVKIPTPYPCPPPLLVQSLKDLTAPLSGYLRVSVGVPGLVRHGIVLEVPAFSRRSTAGPPTPSSSSSGAASTSPTPWPTLLTCPLSWSTTRTCKVPLSWRGTGSNSS